VSNNNKNKNKIMQKLKADLGSQVKSLVKQGLKTSLTAAGGVAGTYIGNPRAGRKIGKGIAAKLSKLVGSGDYASNTTDLAVNSLIKPGANQYATFGDNTSCVRIQHREYIRDIFAGAPGTFTTTSIEVNPGLQTSFPYLSGLANNFEEYRVSGMVFELVSTTSPYNSISAMGSVIAAMQYNAANPPFTTKAQMENSDFAISARLDKSIMYGVECKDLATNNLYIRNQALDTIPKTSTDVGLLQLAIQSGMGITADSVIGELWVSYDIDLMRPHITTRSTGGDYQMQLVLESVVSSTQYLCSENCSFITSCRSGVFSTDKPVILPKFTNTFASVPFLSLTMTPGNVYRVDVDMDVSTAIPGNYVLTLEGCAIIPSGTWPVMQDNTNGRLTATTFYRCTTSFGTNDVSVSLIGTTSANSKWTFNISACGPFDEFKIISPIM